MSMHVGVTKSSYCVSDIRIRTMVKALQHVREMNSFVWKKNVDLHADTLILSTRNIN